MLTLLILQKSELVLYLGHFFKGLNLGIKLLKLLASEGLASSWMEKYRMHLQNIISARVLGFPQG